MIRPVQFESQDRREAQVLAALNAHGIASIEEANQICEQYGLDPYMTCEETQMIWPTFSTGSATILSVCTVVNAFAFSSP